METVSKLLETFQECVARGDQASLFLETRNGIQFANLSVKVPATKPGTFQKNISRSKTRKSPSTVRRDQERLERYRLKKSHESWSPAATSTPEKEEEPPDSTSCSQSVEITTTVDKHVEDVQSDGQDLEKEEDNEKRKCTNVLTAKEIEDAILASIKLAVNDAFEPYVEPYVKKSCQNKDIDNEDDTDNIEAAKQWAKNQKQSFS